MLTHYYADPFGEPHFPKAQQAIAYSSGGVCDFYRLPLHPPV